ncbi:ECF transporter S component [Microbacterium sp.]|uniref:ECF transporter S component n=1 Tax=Microbacterium sp. TaxID=51671 RepID=UPI0039E6060F
MNGSGGSGEPSGSGAPGEPDGSSAPAGSSAPVKRRFPTTMLLTCAAIGVAGGIVLAPAGWLSNFLFATVPFISVAPAGLWLVPGVIAARLLQRPGAAMLVGLISGLVASPFSSTGFGMVLTTLWWAFFAELPFLLVLWRRWSTWQHYAGAAVCAIIYPIAAWYSFNLGTLPLGLQITFFAITMLSCLAGAGLGVLIADRLRTAGVGRRVTA